MDFIRWTRLAVAGLLALTLTTGAAQALMIDDFTQGAVVIEPSSSSFVEYQSGLDPNHTFAGVRQINGFNGLSTERADIRIEIDTTSGGTFQVTTSSTASPSADFTVWFTQEDFLSPGPDLTAGGANAFAIDVVSASFGGAASFDFAFNVDSDASGQRHVDVPVTLHASETPYTIVVPFSDWSFDGQPDDFSEVRRLAFGNNGLTPSYHEYDRLPAGTSLVIDSIYTIPEPASLALLGLGGLAMLMRRRTAPAG